MAFQYATQKQQDKKRDKAAQLAQKWLNKGFTPEQCAEGIWNKVGYTTSAKNDKVQIYGFNNDEKSNKMRILREVSQTEIVKFQ
jgi:hypothetical protein